MKSYLFLSFLLGVIFAISSVKGVTHYCIKVNKSSDCQCLEQCINQTLQDFMDSVNTTVNLNPNINGEAIIMIFMPGKHMINFTHGIKIATPVTQRIIMRGKLDNSVTIEANRNCQDPNNTTLIGCGITFEGPKIELRGFTFHNISIRLKNATATLHNCHLDRSLLNINDSTLTFSGNSTFANSTIFTLYSYSGNITLSGNISFTNNVAFGGGAMYLEASTLNIASKSTVSFSNNIAFESGGAVYLDKSELYIGLGASVTFFNNTAIEKGGAIYFAPGITISRILSQADPQMCFFRQWLEGVGTATTHINFTDNIAKRAGDEIYGASRDECHRFEPNYNVSIHHNKSVSTISLVSSDALRVCMCEANSNEDNSIMVPQCNKTKPIDRTVYPGEFFNVSVAIVGWDYENGVTNGRIYLYIEDERQAVYDMHFKKCKNITFNLKLPKSYNLSSSNSAAYPMNLMSVATVNEYTKFIKHIPQFDGRYDENRAIHYTQLTYNITFDTSCPPGFSLSNQVCNCLLHGEVFHNCSISHHKGFFSWSSTMWVNTCEGAVIYTKYCPFHYCNSTTPQGTHEYINLPDNADYQCAHNRHGTLCGKCKESYSLAVGSSQCIPCKNNNGLALLTFFAAAGLLLVFFINILNLTVTQGMINGLLYYANIIWVYQNFLFPQQVEQRIGDWFKALEFLRVFIAWLNLDFGIQTCFSREFDAFTKTLLQYIFPIYLWIIAGTIIICAHYSTKITKFFGNRAVPVLATLFLFSSTKLLRTIIESIAPTPLTTKGKDGNPCRHNVVWSLDGDYPYFFSWHAVIFVTAAFVFIFLWLPYIVLLFSMQWIRRKSHLKLLKWVPRLTPLYDAYFAPLKDRHHCWFGALLITRCVLLIIFIATYTIFPKCNYILLLVTTALLLGCGNYYRVYKDKHVQISESFFFLHLIVVGGAGILDKGIIDVVRASIFIVLFAFCGLVIWNIYTVLAKTCCWKEWKTRREYSFEFSDASVTLIRRNELNPSNARFRDSILDEI